MNEVSENLAFKRGCADIPKRVFFLRKNLQKRGQILMTSGGFFSFSWFPFIFSPIEIFWSWCLKLSGSNVYEFPRPCNFYWLQKKSPFQGACLYTCSRHLSSPLSSAVLPRNAGRLAVTFRCEQWALQEACQPIWVVCSDLKKSVEGCSRGDRLWRGA